MLPLAHIHILWPWPWVIDPVSRHLLWVDCNVLVATKSNSNVRLFSVRKVIYIYSHTVSVCMSVCLSSSIRVLVSAWDAFVLLSAEVNIQVGRKWRWDFERFPSVVSSPSVFSLSLDCHRFCRWHSHGRFLHLTSQCSAVTTMAMSSWLVRALGL